jgi:hypothetical protein
MRANLLIPNGFLKLSTQPVDNYVGNLMEVALTA